MISTVVILLIDPFSLAANPLFDSLRDNYNRPELDEMVIETERVSNP
jgi:hypothetical protein